MKHNIIATKDYLLVVSESEIGGENDYFYLGKKIIAHLPLNNSPILDGVDLLPPLEDDFMPAGFECEINNPMYALSLQPQITTNPQGHTQWVGKYI